MSFIIDGPDHVGKTTAAERLAEMTGQPIVHAGIKPDDFNHVSDRLDQLQLNAIHDRFHLSGYVYGYLMGLHSVGHLNPATMEHMVNSIRDLSRVTVVVLYDGEDDTYYSRATKNPKDEAFPVETMCEVNRWFRCIADQTIGGSPFCDVAWDIAQGWPRRREFEEWMGIHLRMQTS